MAPFKMYYSKKKVIKKIEIMSYHEPSKRGLRVREKIKKKLLKILEMLRVHLAAPNNTIFGKKYYFKK
jgi:hypothetical protein